MKQVVIEKTTGKVLRWGYCDFASEDIFNPDAEEIITTDFSFSPDIDEVAWRWNGELFIQGEA